jgi:uncharacterized membrane protein
MKVYLAYMAVVFLLNVLIFVTPFLAREGIFLYDLFSPFCHQLTQRSFCLFDDGIRDCSGPYLKENVVVVNGKVGYKFPVCARDMAIYFFMLIGGIVLPLFDLKSKRIPPIWLFVLAIAPMALDGLTQAMGLRESTNLIRVITGAPAGFAIPFYLIPTLNFFIERKQGRK